MHDDYQPEKSWADMLDEPAPVYQYASWVDVVKNKPILQPSSNKGWKR